MDQITFTETLNKEQVNKWLELDYNQWFELFGKDQQKKRKDQSNKFAPKTYDRTTRKNIEKIEKEKCYTRTINYKYRKGESNGRLFSEEWSIQRLSECDRNYLCMKQGPHYMTLI